jgi:hypothetical protein
MRSWGYAHPMERTKRSARLRQDHRLGWSGSIDLMVRFDTSTKFRYELKEHAFPVAFKAI